MKSIRQISVLFLSIFAIILTYNTSDSNVVDILNNQVKYLHKLTKNYDQKFLIENRIKAATLSTAFTHLSDYIYFKGNSNPKKKYKDYYTEFEFEGKEQILDKFFRNKVNVFIEEWKRDILPKHHTIFSNKKYRLYFNLLNEDKRVSSERDSINNTNNTNKINNSRKNEKGVKRRLKHTLKGIKSYLPYIKKNKNKDNHTHTDEISSLITNSNVNEGYPVVIENYHFIDISITMKNYLESESEMRLLVLKTLFWLELFCLEKFHLLLPIDLISISDDESEDVMEEAEQYTNTFFNVFKDATIEIFKELKI